MGITAQVAREDVAPFQDRVASDNTFEEILDMTRDHQISLYRGYNPNDDNDASELGGETHEAPLGNFGMPLLFFALFYILRTLWKMKTRRM